LPSRRIRSVRALTSSDDLHPDLAAAAERVAEAIDIPVVGVDMIVAGINRPDHMVIEANEQPGLANHEPQPTAARFLDLLFPDRPEPAQGLGDQPD
jgi:D-alanine-D-alanine ligase-like ATP-grasp enzyme